MDMGKGLRFVPSSVLWCQRGTPALAGQQKHSNYRAPKSLTQKCLIASSLLVLYGEPPHSWNLMDIITYIRLYKYMYIYIYIYACIYIYVHIYTNLFQRFYRSSRIFKLQPSPLHRKPPKTEPDHLRQGQKQWGSNIGSWRIHPWSLTWKSWNLKIALWKSRSLWTTIIFRFYVKLWGCKGKKTATTKIWHRWWLLKAVGG